MLLEYVEEAMERAVYEKLEDGTFSGRIAACPGVVATGKTLSQCQKELQEILDGWLIVKLRHGDKIPLISGINLNQSRHISTLRPLHA
jgi:predicted RNase H-like HicB family nuclease